MNTFQCPCGNALYFANHQCLACSGMVAFDPWKDQMVNYEPHEDLLCENGRLYQICNWVRLPHSLFCEACHFNKVIPNLNQSNSLILWSKMEQAKRRTLYGMIQSGLRFEAWHAAPEGQGLAFEFKHPQWEPVSTGYLNGTITIDLTEADDLERERVKHHLGESYRTLIGHFRHEIGHYFWDRMLQPLPLNHPWRIAFAELFGDPLAQDYQQSLQNHYQQKAQEDGNHLPPEGFISDYAAAHPSEDWAETWAHYWHILDALQTADRFNLGGNLPPNEVPALSLPWSVFHSFDEKVLRAFQQQLARWIALSPAINEIATSLGHPALYPFLTSRVVMEKLSLVHLLVHARSHSPESYGHLEVLQFSS